MDRKRGGGERRRRAHHTSRSSAVGRAAPTDVGPNVGSARTTDSLACPDPITGELVIYRPADVTYLITGVGDTDSRFAF